ncbi:MAG: hypothetical protein ACRDOY_07290, partial [Nocardioidaceae bacterium]
KIATDRGLGGPIHPACSYLMKSPPTQHPDDQGRTNLEAFIRGEIGRLAEPMDAVLDLVAD